MRPPSPPHLIIRIGRSPSRRLSLWPLRRLLPAVDLALYLGLHRRLSAERLRSLRDQLPLLLRHSRGLRLRIDGTHRVLLAII